MAAAGRCPRYAAADLVRPGPACRRCRCGPPRDQELVLAVARGAGFSGRFELATRPAQPVRSVDVGLIHDVHRALVLAECWNTFGDVGAGTRSSRRKLAEAHDLAVARWGDVPHRVGLVWVVRASEANRALVGHDPEVFASQFPGSSIGWVETLAVGADPPDEAGLVWCDVKATRLFAWRRPRVGLTEARPAAARSGHRPGSGPAR